MSLVPAVNSNDHVLNADGLIELVEYGDFQCPYCGRAYPIVRRLKNEFGINLKFVFHSANLPSNTLCNKLSDCIIPAIAVVNKQASQNPVI